MVYRPARLPIIHDRQAHLVSRYGLTAHTALHASHLLDRCPELRISSGRRTALRNAAVGGVPGSWHLRGRAVDFTGPLSVLKEAREVAFGQRVSPRCTGPEEVFVEYPGERRQHLHVAW